jgi:hypothetical protein
VHELAELSVQLRVHDSPPTALQTTAGRRKVAWQDRAAKARELVAVARRYGYGPEELTDIIEQVSLELP